MVGKTALNKEMKHLNGAYFRTNINTIHPIGKSLNKFIQYRSKYPIRRIFYCSY